MRNYSIIYVIKLTLHKTILLLPIELYIQQGSSNIVLWRVNLILTVNLGYIKIFYQSIIKICLILIQIEPNSNKLITISRNKIKLH